MKIFFLITMIFTLIDLFKGEFTMDQFTQYLDNYPEAGNYNINPKMFIFMRIIPKKSKKAKRRYDFNGKVIENFIQNLGVRNEVMNIENRHYISVIDLKSVDDVDLELLKETFHDLIDAASFRSPDLFKKENDVNQDDFTKQDGL